MNKKGQTFTEFLLVFAVLLMAVAGAFALYKKAWKKKYDMTANEAAFTAMRSAAVTKPGTKLATRKEEAQKRVKNYMSVMYPFTIIDPKSELIGSFGYSDKETVKPYFIKSKKSKEESEEVGADIDENEGEAVTIWEENRAEKQFKDHSGRNTGQHTVKVYYFTRAMFGFLSSPQTSERSRFDDVAGTKRRQTLQFRKKQDDTVARSGLL